MNADQAANVIASLALLAAAAAVMRGELNAREQDRRTDEAERIARNAVAEAKRAADALEEIERHRAPVVRWQVATISGYDRKVENVGGATAYDVTLTCQGAVVFGGPPAPRDLDPGEAIRFGALTADGAPPMEIGVTWQDAPGAPPRTWTHPM